MKKKKLTEEEIDNIVIAEADDDSKWSDPVLVIPSAAIGLKIKASTLSKAQDIVRRKRIRHVEDWLVRVIEERVALEEGSTKRVTRRAA